MFQSPFLLGKLVCPNNIFYSPLAGCSDYPFRKMSAKYRPGLMFCEMVKMQALLRNVIPTYRMLEYSEEMRPIGAQLVGSDIKFAAQSAKIIEDLGFDSLDYNCGCPVDKITKDGSGSGMLKEPEKIADILAEMVQAVSIPVTVKIRAGWDNESICAAQITRLAEKAGAKAIAVHGRTRQQAYRGESNWGWIKEAVEAADEIKVIGNGGVFSAEDAENMFKETGCDAVLVSRATMGQPWIAEDISRYFLKEPSLDRGKNEQMQALREHFVFMQDFAHSESWVATNMRRIACWYFKSSPNRKHFRMKINQASNLAEVEEALNFYELNG